MPVIINGTTGVTFPNGVTMSDGTSAPVTVAQGGTGANTASAARTSLSAAQSGANTDITSLGGLTTALSVAQGGTGANTATAAFNALNPMTTTGDILYEASPTVAARLPIGSAGQVLTVSGGIPAWGTVGTSINTQEFTSSGTWTKPSSGNICAVILIGGGGGGGRASGDGNGVQGGNGGYPVFALFKLSDLSSTVSITVGASGSPSTNNTVPGGNGGFTAFGTFLRSYGGTGGVSYNGGSLFYPAEITDSGSILGSSAIGGTGFPYKTQSNNNQVATQFGTFAAPANGGGGGPNGSYAGVASVFGTGGIGTISGTGGAGTGFGAGGGTGVSGGGAGTAGYCRVVVW